MHILENYRKTPAYKLCWKITVLYILVTVCLSVFLQTAIVFFFLISCGSFFITFTSLSIFSIFQSKQCKKTEINNNIASDIIIYITIFTITWFCYSLAVGSIMCTIIFAIISIIGLFCKKQNKKTDYKTSIIADIGYIIGLLICCNCIVFLQQIFTN